MSQRKQLSVSKLKLDVENVRLGSEQCTSDKECILGIYEDNPKKLKELANSIREKGFLEGENILVQQTAPGTDRHPH